MPFLSLIKKIKNEAQDILSRKKQLSATEYQNELEGLIKKIIDNKIDSYEIQHYDSVLKEVQSIGQISSWVNDTIERKHYWSDEAYRILGYEPGEVEISIDLITSHIHDDDKDSFNDQRENWLFNKELDSVETEFRIIDKQKKLKYCKVYAKLIRDKKGFATKIIGILQDVSDFRKIEHALEESKERYKTLVENIPMGIAVHIDGIIKYMNNEAAKILGIKSKNKYIGKSVWEFVDKEYHKIVMDRIEKVLGKGENVGVVEEKFIKTNGKRIDVEVSGTSILYQGNTASQVVFRDISEQKISHFALQQSADIVNYIQVGIHIYLLENIKDDRTLRMVAANPASELLTGIKVRDIIGKTLDENFPGLREKGIPQAYANVVRSQTPIEIEDLYYTDNRVIAGAFNIKAFPLPGNQVGVSFDNITKKKKAEDDLKSSEEMYRMLVATSPDAICMTDIEGEIIFASENMATIHGYGSYKELLGKDLITLVHKEDINKARNGMVMTLKYGFSKAVQYRLVRKDGSNYFGEVNSALIRHSNDAPKAFIMNIRDISDRKSYENQIIKAKEKAEEADKLKSAFLANMSHEIRTPLNGIVGFVSLLGRDNLSKESKNDYIDIVHKSSQQLLTIINDIVDISKMEANLLDIIWNNCNINELLDDIFTNFENERLKNEKYDLELIMEKVFENDKAVILTDEVRLKQLLNNLISNALKFTEKGYIKIGYKIKNKEFIEFFVEDTGIGISKENQQIIFDRFRQEDDSHTRKFGGTGLGLTICKGLAKLLGGEIFLESDKGKGSRFSFTHPYKPADGKTVIIEDIITVTDTEYNWEGKNILVVDDTEEILFYIEEVLDGSGAKILKAKNAIETFGVLKKNSNIHLILLDIQLPDMNGYEVTKKILSDYKNIPIISQTAYALTGDKEKALAAGCVDYIPKPIHSDMLFKLIDKYIL